MIYPPFCGHFGFLNAAIHFQKVFGSRTTDWSNNIPAKGQSDHALERRWRNCPDSELAGKTLSSSRGWKTASPLDKLLPEAFAVVREHRNG